ncbi:hypothetical protein BAUCODRAFT_27805 [Baudoinia panamericana UAMH 10762]|uniref:Uncharacterized protein n=1 Tax=Baudoinia panamericana (strain UAMH 10762) TaxID=717646 RepID=M2M868_BAUPA|nr:uncharacterized protein BAUCODRAFT_27805 [Baudoinia panamericana UAMH 10762]EMC92541.1 hypothetical protein BAUCODRAFT_27805 [Baudoinia panamericana UAMH 10762]
MASSVAQRRPELARKPKKTAAERAADLTSLKKAGAYGYRLKPENAPFEPDAVAESGKDATDAAATASQADKDAATLLYETAKATLPKPRPIMKRAERTRTSTGQLLLDLEGEMSDEHAGNRNESIFNGVGDSIIQAYVELLRVQALAPCTLKEKEARWRTYEHKLDEPAERQEEVKGVSKDDVDGREKKDDTSQPVTVAHENVEDGGGSSAAGDGDVNDEMEAPAQALPNSNPDAAAESETGMPKDSAVAEPASGKDVATIDLNAEATTSATEETLPNKPEKQDQGTAKQPPVVDVLQALQDHASKMLERRARHQGQT